MNLTPATTPALRLVPVIGHRLRALLPTRADLAAVRRNPKQDLMAGVTVAIVALPLALAFGVASGLGAYATGSNSSPSSSASRTGSQDMMRPRTV